MEKMNTKKWDEEEWYEHDSYNCLTRMGSVTDDPRYAVRFQGKCYGYPGGSMSELVDGLAWQEGTTISEREQWEADNWKETIQVYNRREDEFTWSKPLGAALTAMDEVTMDEAMQMARQRVEVMDLEGQAGHIVGVHGKSEDHDVTFLVRYQGGVIKLCAREELSVRPGQEEPS